MAYEKFKSWFERNWNHPIMGWVLAFSIPFIFIPLVMIPIILIPILLMEMIFNLLRLGSNLFTGGSLLDQEGLGFSPENLLIAFCLMGMIVIFYSRLKPIADKNKATLILNLKQRWTHPEIIKGRMFIHSFILNTKDKNALAENFKVQLLQFQVSDKQKDMENYFSLKEVLGFLNDLGYMLQENQIEIEKMTGLFGNDGKILVDIFGPYVAQVNKEDNKNYQQFIKLEKAVLNFYATAEDDDNEDN